MHDAQTIPPRDQRPDYADEISLVDLAATFIRRRRVFYSAVIAVTLAGLVYALLTPNTYEYISLVQVAQKDGDEFVQSPKASIATLKNRWLPEVQTAYRAKHNAKLPFDVIFNNPEGTGLVRFSSTATDKDGQAVEAAHKVLMANLKDYQRQLLKKEKASLNRQIQALDKIVDTLKGEKETSEVIGRAIEKNSTLKGELESLQGVEVLITSRQSSEKIAPKRSLIMTLTVLFGVMMGVFLAFISEFALSVRERLENDSF